MKPDTEDSVEIVSSEQGRAGRRPNESGLSAASALCRTLGSVSSPCKLDGGGGVKSRVGNEFCLAEVSLLVDGARSTGPSCSGVEERFGSGMERLLDKDASFGAMGVPAPILRVGTSLGRRSEER